MSVSLFVLHNLSHYRQQVVVSYCILTLFVDQVKGA